MNKIPIIGTAIVNTPYWINRLIESIDYPVAELFIVNNNGRDQITKELDLLASNKYEFIDKIHVCHLPGNIGCSGAWNLIIKAYMNSPYWIIVNHDVKFTAGLLEKLHLSSLEEQYGLIHPEANEDGYGKWDLFLIKDFVIKSCGLFDENLYPAYGEDFDYIMRLINTDIKSKILNIPYLHGEKDYATTGSQTWRNDQSLKDKLSQALYLNETRYLDQKWGKDWRRYSPYWTPFNMKELPNSYTTYDLYFNRHKNLGF